MKNQTIESVNRDLEALDFMDRLETELLAEYERIKNLNPRTVLAEASKMLMTRQFDLSKLGLSLETHEQFDTFVTLNRVSRSKHRAHALALREKLLKAEQIEVVNE